MSDRRHEATPTRLRKARRQGDVAVSQELANAVSLAGGFVALGVLAAPLAITLMQLARFQFQNAAAPLRDGMVAGAQLAEVASATLPLLSALVAVGWFGHGAQRGFQWNSSSLAIGWHRLDPGQNLRRVGRDTASRALGLFKAILLLVLIGVLLWNEIPRLLSLGELPALGISVALTNATLRLATSLSFALIGLGLLDYLWQRFCHRRRLRMTDDELRQEWKEDAGGRRKRRR